MGYNFDLVFFGFGDINTDRMAQLNLTNFDEKSLVCPRSLAAWPAPGPHLACTCRSAEHLAPPEREEDRLGEGTRLAEEEPLNHKF